MSSFSIEAFCTHCLYFIFGEFWPPYILDLAKTVSALQILSQKFTRNFGINKLWRAINKLESHVLVTLLHPFHRGTLSIHW